MQAPRIIRTHSPRAGAVLAAAICIWLCAWAQAGEQTANPAPAAAREPVKAEQLQKLVADLGSDSYAAREAATTALIEAGDAALPALQKAKNSDDLEVAWRAAGTERAINWGLTPALWARLGDVMAQYEKGDATLRERIVRIVRVSADQQAIPVLRRVLRKEQDDAVKQAAAVMLADLGSAGLAALVEENVPIAGLDQYDAGVHLMLGNSFLSEKNYQRAEEHYMKALETEPANCIALYNLACVKSLEKDVDKAIAWLQKAIDAGYGDFEWMEKDTDLDNIRNDARYKELLRKGPKPKEKPEQPEQITPR